MKGSIDFESELHAQLNALTEPTPTVTRDFLTAVRHNVMRRRRRLRATAAVAALLLVVGLGAVLRLPANRADPTQPSAPTGTTHRLLDWPTRTAGSDRFDPPTIAQAWPGPHTVVHLLYAGPLPHRGQVAIVEGRADTGEARMAVLTRYTGDWQVRLDIAGFDTPPQHLLVVLDPTGASSTIVLLAAPDAPTARINDGEGRLVAIMSPGSAEQRTTTREVTTSLRFYIAASPQDTAERSLQRWGTQEEPGTRLTLIVPGGRIG